LRAKDRGLGRRGFELIGPNYEVIEEVVAKALEFVLNSEIGPQGRQQGNTIPESIRKKIRSSNGKSCPLCGILMVYTPGRTPPLKKNEPTWEHVLELTLGGKNTLDNTSVICHSCNNAASILLSKYLGINDKKIGSREWKEEFVGDKRNLVRLHRYLEWKINSILLERIDGGQGLGRLWTSIRWGSPEKKSVEIKEGKKGYLGKLVDWLSSLFRVGGKSPKSVGVKSHKGGGVKRSKKEEMTELGTIKPDSSKDAEEKAPSKISSIFTQQVLSAFKESEGGALGFPDIFEIEKNIKKEAKLTWNQFFTEFGMTNQGAMNTKTKRLLEICDIPHTLTRDSETGIDYAHYKVPSKKNTRKNSVARKQEEIKEEGKRKATEITKRIINGESRQLPAWSELDTSNKDDLAKLLISLIGGDRVNAVSLGLRITSYQTNNGLEDTGSKALLKAFGLHGHNMSLNKIIEREFSEEIAVEATAFRTEPSTGEAHPVSFEYRVKPTLIESEEE
tara:strand:+ start:117 stop:1628 length:1512 start_codon:yes stop_codon:yes gene_type:complete